MCEEPNHRQAEQQPFHVPFCLFNLFLQRGSLRVLANNPDPHLAYLVKAPVRDPTDWNIPSE